MPTSLPITGQEIKPPSFLAAFQPDYVILMNPIYVPEVQRDLDKMSVKANAPGGQGQCLIDIQDWDFNWQGMYRFKDPIAISAGTTFSLEAFYDNSADNVKNPNDPPKPVSWGEATTDEMCIAFLGVTFDIENIQSGQTVDTSWIPRISSF